MPFFVPPNKLAIVSSPSSRPFGQLIYDFEDQTFQGWTDQTDQDGQILIASDYALDSYSLKADRPTITSSAKHASISPLLLDGGRQISKFSFNYLEGDNSTYAQGGGVRLYDNNDNVIAGAATDNPQWYVHSNSGDTFLYQSFSYYQWVFVELTFDWQNGTFDYFFSGFNHTESGTLDLIVNSNVQTIIWENFPWDATGTGTLMWIDNITITE